MKNNSTKTSAPVKAASPDSTIKASDGADVPSPGSAKEQDPEVLEKARRRSFSGEYKQRILREVDEAKESGELGAIGALLRREGLYSSSVVAWRKQRDAGELAGLTPAKRGRRPKPRDPLTLENEKLRRENARLQDELRKAAIVIDVQKKLAALLGTPIEPTTEEP